MNARSRRRRPRRPWAAGLARIAARSAVVGAAFALDRAIGDPVRPTHPARLMGHLVAGAEWLARRSVQGPEQEKQAGIALAVVLPLGVMAGTFTFLRRLPWYLRPAAETWLVATALAGRDLGDAARGVEAALSRSLDDARREVGMIVGRDTVAMSEDEVVRATVETVAENTSDGVVAPLLYAVAGGAPLALGFKAVSTLDSMVGYKNELYLHLGWASARLDDAANYIPARATAMLATLAAGGSLGAVTRWWEDRVHHDSPNAGLVEAAFAQALGVRLGGAAVYGGRLVDRAAVGSEYAPPVRADIERAVRLSEQVGRLALSAGLAGLWVSAWAARWGRR
jgi:adenosylcobinamide-phosphate synthase